MITIHQRYRQTDRQTTCDRNTALCTKVHRAVISLQCIGLDSEWYTISGLSKMTHNLLLILNVHSNSLMRWKRKQRWFQWFADSSHVDFRVTVFLWTADSLCSCRLRHAQYQLYSITSAVSYLIRLMLCHRVIDFYAIVKTSYSLMSVVMQITYNNNNNVGQKITLRDPWKLTVIDQILLQLTDYAHKLTNFCEPSTVFWNTTTLYAHFVNI